MQITYEIIYPLEFFTYEFSPHCSLVLRRLAVVCFDNVYNIGALEEKSYETVVWFFFSSFFHCFIFFRTKKIIRLINCNILVWYASSFSDLNFVSHLLLPAIV